MTPATTKRAKLFGRTVDDRVVMAAIILNALVQFLRAFPRWEHTQLLFGLDYVCTLYFVYELVTKLVLLGPKAYFQSGWNKFDFIIIAASSPHLLAPFLDITDFAILLVLRTVRLVRVLRLLHFIPDRDRLWNGMTRALRASVGVIFALVVYNFVLGLTACFLFRDTGSPYFADPLTSMYSVFKVFTVEGWYEIADSVAATSPEMVAFVIRAFFVFAVTTGGIIGLSLANAVFVDEMVIDNTDEIERLVDELRQDIGASRERTDADIARLEGLLEDIAARLPPRPDDDASG